MAALEPLDLGLHQTHSLQDLQYELLEAVRPDSGAASRTSAARRVLLIVEGVARQLGYQRQACCCSGRVGIDHAFGLCVVCGRPTESSVVRMFGSCSNGFQTGTSDMDIVLLTSRRFDVLQVLAEFKTQIMNCRCFEHITQIFGAQVPLLKFTDVSSSIEIDLCVNNELGTRNSELLSSYSWCDERVGWLGRLVKDWAKSLELVGTTDGLLSSYTYMLLVVYFLQVLDEPVVPNLQLLATESCQVPGPNLRTSGNAWCETKFVSVSEASPPQQPSNNKQSLVQLLLGFFKFYSSEFDWEREAVSVRLGEAGIHVDKMTLFVPASTQMWCIEDPFDLRHNLAAKCSEAGKVRIVTSMRETYDKLTRGDRWQDACPKVTHQPCYMKCRITAAVSPQHLEQVFQGCQLLRMWCPTPLPDVHFALAFFEFASQAGRRRGQSMNEFHMAADCTLQLLYTTSHNLKEAQLDTRRPLVKTVTVEGQIFAYWEGIRHIAAYQGGAITGGKDFGCGGKGFGGKNYCGKDYGGKNSGGKDFGGKDYSGKGCAGKEDGGQDCGGKASGDKDYCGKDYGGKNSCGKDDGGKEYGKGCGEDGQDMQATKGSTLGFAPNLGKGREVRDTGSRRTSPTPSAESGPLAAAPSLRRPGASTLWLTPPHAPAADQAAGPPKLTLAARSPPPPPRRPGRRPHSGPPKLTLQAPSPPPPRRGRRPRWPRSPDSPPPRGPPSPAALAKQAEYSEWMMAARARFAMGRTGTLGHGMPTPVPSEVGSTAERLKHAAASELAPGPPAPPPAAVAEAPAESEPAAVSAPAGNPVPAAIPVLAPPPGLVAVPPQPVLTEHADSIAEKDRRRPALPPAAAEAPAVPEPAAVSPPAAIPAAILMPAAIPAPTPPPGLAAALPPPATSEHTANAFVVFRVEVRCEPFSQPLFSADDRALIDRALEKWAHIP